MDKADLSDSFTFLRLRYHSRRTSAGFQSGAVRILGGRPPKIRTDPITAMIRRPGPSHVLMFKCVKGHSQGLRDTTESQEVTKVL